MVLNLLKLRIRQTIRVVLSVGLPLIIIALVVLSGIGFQFFDRLLSLPTLWILPLSFLCLFYIDSRRKDKQFISDISPSFNYARLFMGLEYFLLLLPLIIFQAYHHRFFHFSGLCLLPFLVPYLPNVKVFSLKPRIVSLGFIPTELYELRITIERYFTPFLICWIVSFLGFLHFAFFLVALLFGLVIFVSAYSYNEPIEMINISRRFLDRKIMMNLGFSGLLFLPQFLIAFFIYPESYLLLGYGILYFFTILALAIVYKYAKYDPLRSSTLNSTLVGISMVLGLMPGLVIGSLVLVLFYYFSAKKTLNYYLC